MYLLAAGLQPFLIIAHTAFESCMPEFSQEKEYNENESERFH
ncbi:hypothetical protein [Streptococcus devriesei]|nr:hypothetical protein [Streptococcus devriesei]